MPYLCERTNHARCRQRRWPFSRSALLAAALVGVSSVQTAHATPAISASELRQQKAVDLMTAGYSPEVFVAAGVSPAQVDEVFEIATGLTLAILNFNTANNGARSARAVLRTTRDQIRRTGETDELLTTLGDQLIALGAAEAVLRERETDLFNAVRSSLAAYLSQSAAANLETLTERREWQVPVHWRLADLQGEEPESAERLYLVMSSSPDADLDQHDLILRDRITADPDVAAAAFRVESGIVTATIEFAGFMTQ